MKNKSLQAGLPNAGVIHIADMIPQLITRFGIQRRRNFEQITQAWKETVGVPFDSVTNAIELKRGILTVAVKHNAFVQELSFRQNELIQSMQSKIIDEKIKKIKWIIEN
jgi:predicted nucleic acid-binding Zn ribbon protein